MVNYSGLDETIIQSMQKTENGVWFCLHCSFSSKHRHHVKNHVEARHIDSGGFICPECSTVCPTRKALAMHNSRKHKFMWVIFFQIQYRTDPSFYLGPLDKLIEQHMLRIETGQWQCQQCSFSSKQRHHVKNHIESKHIESGGFLCQICNAICRTRQALTMHNFRKHKFNC